MPRPITFWARRRGAVARGQGTSLARQVTLRRRVEMLTERMEQDECVDETTKHRKVPTNPRVVQALGDQHVNATTLQEELQRLEPLPNISDEEATATWLRRVIPLMDAKSRYCKELARALAQHDSRIRQTMRKGGT